MSLTRNGTFSVERKPATSPRSFYLLDMLNLLLMPFSNVKHDMAVGVARMGGLDIIKV